jgi:hypothetical protein
MQLALSHWRTQVITSLQKEGQRLSQVIIRAFRLARVGENIDREPLKAIRDSLVATGFDGYDLTRECILLYQEVWEAPLVAYTVQSKGTLSAEQILRLKDLATDVLRPNSLLLLSDGWASDE